MTRVDAVLRALQRVGRFPPVHPDLARPRAVVVVGDIDPLVGVQGRIVSLACHRDPSFWLLIDAAHSRVVAGNLREGGYVMTYPTGRRSTVRVQHVDHPRFGLTVRLFT